MAKSNELPADEPLPVTALLLTFRDKIYTSRTLVIPNSNRTLAVTKARVEVSVSDEQAVSYLKANPEFEQLME